ncbi:MAG: beta-glucuronidase [Terrimicrobiaceae bacterium]
MRSLFDLPVRASSQRDTHDLSGLWSLRLDPEDRGLADSWAGVPIPRAARRPVAVPASYNDLYVEAGIRDHVGPVWYEREFFVPSTWSGRRVFVRFESVTHHADVFVDGEFLVSHRGGYLPFGAELTGRVKARDSVRLTVRVDNRLDWTTLPPGEIDEVPLPDGTTWRTQRYFHDFFNYAGIDRPVLLFSTGPVVVSGLRVYPEKTEQGWQVRCEGGCDGGGQLCWSLLDPGGKEVGSADGDCATIPVSSPLLWEPGSPVLYTLRVRAVGGNDEPSDEVDLRIGLRSLSVGPSGLEVNGRPFYFRGFGKHEDFHVIGKGLSLPLLIRDFELLRWIGANSVRTTHYPYSEAFLDLADELGGVVISEVPAVGQCLGFGEKAETTFCAGRVDDGALSHHLEVTTRLISRDHHRPSVVMWSLGNEPNTQDPGARPYFEKVFARARELDPSRPLMLVEHQPPDLSQTAHLSDIIGLNRYFGWYSEPGQLPLVESKLRDELEHWHARFGKPVFVTEYGADALAGFHSIPSQMFSEEYQEELLAIYHRVFDTLPFVCGEHVWNFADFATKQGITRVGGNRKGVFTRDRQPKSVAKLLRERWRH